MKRHKYISTAKGFSKMDPEMTAWRFFRIFHALELTSSYPHILDISAFVDRFFI